MRENDKHQFAAILFADIAGYTALMQNNEAQALIKLKNFKLILEAKVPINKGQIIQFYGDGCLVVFKDSLAALTCAIDLQKAFSREEDIPVRIGLHEGEVVFRDENVFGHAVNIASRVESMGIAGAVLMSSNFRDSIKNNPTFQLAWLGKFNLKNVSDPMSIYALTNEGFPIPKQSKIAGEIIKMNSNQKQKKYDYLYWLIPAIIAIGLGGGLWHIYQSPKMDEQILKERIAVLPFEDNTNDPNLAVLGNMASDWINTGLMDISEAEVVSPFTVRTHQEAIGILANDPQGRPSFAELTGARNLITGTYYKNGGHIIFKLELVNALDGKLRFSFKEIKGKAKQKEILLTKLREQVTGYWAAKDLVDARKIEPPKAEAYQLYLKSLQKKGTEADLLEILAIDSNFYLPRIHFLNISKGARLGEKKLHFEFLNRHFDRLSEYERALFSYLKGLYLGEPMMVFKKLNAIRQKYPRDFLLNHSSANIALNGLHNPALALAIYEELPLAITPAKTAGIYWNERLLNMVTCFIELNQLQNISNLLNSVTPNPEIDNNTYLKTKLSEALVGNNNTKAYEQLKTTLKTKPYHYFWVNIELLQSNLLTDEFRLQQEKDLVKAYEQLASNNPNRFLWRNFMAVITNKEELLSLKNLEKLPVGAQIGNIAAAGQFYINAGKSEKVQAFIDKLQAYINCDYSGQVQTVCGASYYYMGLLQAQIEEKGAAIKNLRKAKTIGVGKELHKFQYSRYLAVLFDMPEFQDFIQPVWPAANDGEVFVKEVKEYHKTPDSAADITSRFKQKESIELEPFNHFYQLNLGTTNNYNRQKIAFYYQLDRTDNEWKRAENEQIIIGNLPYGKQSLQIKAQFLNGQFTRKVLEIPVNVPRPFYLNIGFVTGMLIFIFIGVYFGAGFIIPDQKSS